VLIFSDACHSGRILGDEESESMPPAGKVLAQFSSDRHRKGYSGNQCRVVVAVNSYAEPALQHGLFTFYLIKGALGDADYNGDELISNMEIGNYVLEKVSRAEPDQKPVFTNSITMLFCDSVTAPASFLRQSACLPGRGGIGQPGVQESQDD
jgi:hypothetical protein